MNCTRDDKDDVNSSPKKEQTQLSDERKKQNEHMRARMSITAKA